jgi:hypothetical protein
MICKICGKQQHHCTSCCSDEWYDEDKYCSSECAKAGREYNQARDIIIRLLNKLDADGKQDLGMLIDGYDGLDCDVIWEAAKDLDQNIQIV